MNEEFKILSPRDHIRQRVGMYLGSTSVETREGFLFGEWKTVSYIPALSKMIDEIIDNAVDEAIRTNFEYANEIRVDARGHTVLVRDNGRGIPQDDVLDEATGQKISKPVAAWTRVNSGTSFHDDRVTIGTNGVGSSATNFLSESFHGKTWRGGKQVWVDCKNGALEVDYKVSTIRSYGSGTEVQFNPDFSLFDEYGITLDDYGTLELVENRLLNLQTNFPKIKFYFNGRRVPRGRFLDYARMFVPSDLKPVLVDTEKLSFFVGPSEDGYRTDCFVNGVNCRQGGSYIDHVVGSLIDELEVLIRKKHKVTVSRSVIRNGLTVVLFARDFENPKFDSQTKERLTSPASYVKAHYQQSQALEFPKLARKILDTPEIIEPIVEAELAKKLAAEKRAAKAAQKKLKKAKVAKHIAASSQSAMLALVEGDSALGFLLKVRDAKKLGAYPLRGVVMNTWDMKPSDVLKNKELSELVAVLGLDINDPDSVDDMTYKNICTLTDADHDGYHISSLLVAFFYKFWPRLLEEHRVHIMRSPIMISSKGKEVEWFFSYDESRQFKENNKGWYHRYIKGLGSLKEEEYDRVINRPFLDTVHVDDVKLFQMMFGGNSELRKEFMMEGSQ